VADSKDRCPKTKMGQAVDNKGCHAIVSLTGLNFATASADLTAGAKRQLAQIISNLEKNPKIHVRIESHTDSQGNEASNQGLSEDRAESVMQYLIEQGISAKRLDAQGYGENSPIASNDTEDGMRQNRRVDFVVTKN
ncbi:MAG: OmpA family protein, partial [Pseudomonadales bacterium]|nr:OmpA family protein [Pseudomonadales bacterium]